MFSGPFKQCFFVDVISDCNSISTSVCLGPVNLWEIGISFLFIYSFNHFKDIALQCMSLLKSVLLIKLFWFGI